MAEETDDAGGSVLPGERVHNPSFKRTGRRIMDDIFSADDRGNVVNFYERMEDGEFESAGRLDREAGESGNEYAFENWSGDELVAWCQENGYGDEIAEAEEPAV